MKASFSSWTQQERLMSYGLFIASRRSFSEGTRNGMGSTSSPHSPLYAPGMVNAAAAAATNLHQPTDQLTHLPAAAERGWAMERQQNQCVNSRMVTGSNIWLRYSPMQEVEVRSGWLWVWELRPCCYISGLLLPDMVTTLKPAITLRSHPSYPPGSAGSGNSSVCLRPFRVALESLRSGWNHLLSSPHHSLCLLYPAALPNHDFHPCYLYIWQGMCAVCYLETVPCRVETLTDFWGRTEFGSYWHDEKENVCPSKLVVSLWWETSLYWSYPECSLNFN